MLLFEIKLDITHVHLDRGNVSIFLFSYAYIFILLLRYLDLLLSVHFVLLHSSESIWGRDKGGKVGASVCVLWSHF